MVPAHAPSVFDYDDYRKYLKDYYAYKKSTDKKFSYSVFAYKAGLNHRNHLLRVVKGNVSLTLPMAKKYTKALRLKRREEDYFTLLVESDTKSKVRYLSKKITQSTMHEILISEMVYLENFSPDPIWISRYTNGIISAKDAREALKSLLRYKIIKKRKNEWVKSHVLIDWSSENMTSKERDTRKQEIVDTAGEIFKKAKSGNKLLLYTVHSCSEKSMMKLLDVMETATKKHTLENEPSDSKDVKLFSMCVTLASFDD